MNKIFRCLLFASLILSFSSSYAKILSLTSEGIIYELNTSTSDVTVVGFEDEILQMEEVYIPGSYSGSSNLKVTALAPNLFADNKKVKTVKFHENITVLSEGCFRNCENLERIEGAGIEEFGAYCFANCPSLRFINDEELIKDNTLIIPLMNCKRICANAFDGWDVEKLYIYARLASRILIIDEGAFSGMHNLKTAEFARVCRSRNQCGVPFTDNKSLEEIRFSSEYINSSESELVDTKFNEYPSRSYNALDYYKYFTERQGTPALKRVIVEKDCVEPVAMYYGDSELVINSEKFLLGDRVTKNTYGTYRDLAYRWEHGSLYSVKNLTIGENVKEICVGYFKNLNVVTVLSPEPPSYGNKFADEVYRNHATLRVHASSVDAYKSTPGWMRFNIESIEPTGVEEIEAGNAGRQPEYYDITGRRVTSPEKGIYIVKDSSGVRKVIF